MQTAAPILDRGNSGKPWYAQLWPWLLMSGPFLVVIAASVSAWLAFTRQDAMVVDDYYKAGNAINQDIHRDTAATNMGLSLDAVYDAAKGKMNGSLYSFGNPLATSIVIRLAHATQPEKDKLIVAQADQRGRFSADLPFLDQGRWEVTIENQRRDWRLTGTWKWPQEQSIRLKADLPPAD
jgi:hypothetical protein